MPGEAGVGAGEAGEEKQGRQEQEKQGKQEQEKQGRQEKQGKQTQGACPLIKHSLCSRALGESNPTRGTEPRRLYLVQKELRGNQNPDGSRQRRTTCLN